MHHLLSHNTKKRGASAAVLGDPFFNNVTLLMHCDGADAATTFTDVKGHTITAVGNAQVDTAESKFGGASCLTNGSGNYLSISDSIDWDLPGSFTIEFWCKSNCQNNTLLLNLNAANNAMISVWFTGSTGRPWFYIGGDYIQSSQTLGNCKDGNWHHIAFQRDANNLCTLYFDGALIASRTKSYSVTSNGLEVGRMYDIGQTWIDEIRITKGVVRYSANFTPPTQAFSDILQFSPDPFFNNVVFLSHMNGTDASTTFNDIKGHTITASGNVQVDTAESKFGGASTLFDGIDDYLSVASSTDYSLIADFTIEFWFHADVQNALNIINIYTAAASSSEWAVSIRTSNTSGAYLRFVGYTNSAATSVQSDTGIITYNTWHHAAIVRSGTIIYFYLDGVLFGVPKTYSNTPNVSTGTALWIGKQNGVGGDFDGHLDDIRITKGIARYTTNFTPPTQAFPDSLLSSVDPFFNNVVLLAHMNGTNGSTTFTDIKGHAITPSGNAQINTSDFKFGGASALFDGTGDYLSVADSVDWDFTGKFTVEFWVNQTQVSGGMIRLTGTTELDMGIDSNGRSQNTVYSSGLSDPFGPNLADGMWHHVAFVREGAATNGCVLFIDGNVRGRTTQASTFSPTGITMAGYSSSAFALMIGRLDDVRITKDVARYSTNFTTPTAAFPDQS